MTSGPFGNSRGPHVKPTYTTFTGILYNYLVLCTLGTFAKYIQFSTTSLFIQGFPFSNQSYRNTIMTVREGESRVARTSRNHSQLSVSYKTLGPMPTYNMYTRDLEQWPVSFCVFSD